MDFMLFFVVRLFVEHDRIECCWLAIFLRMFYIGLKSVQEKWVGSDFWGVNGEKF